MADGTRTDSDVLWDWGITVINPDLGELGELADACRRVERDVMHTALRHDLERVDQLALTHIRRARADAGILCGKVL